MRQGFVLPWGTARTAADYALAAERSGWDGFFVWDGVWSTDPWVSLTAAAMVTETIQLGTMLTPLSRRRPWKVAAETATLDDLCNGRLILATGLGAIDTGFAAFGEVTDRRIRAELLDESLNIVTTLWRGEPFNHSGKHYRIDVPPGLPPPPPTPLRRIPVWVAGAWPRPKSMERVARWDGWLVEVKPPGQTHQPVTAEAVAAGSEYLKERRDGRPIEIVVEGKTDPTTGRDDLAQWSEAGATWWLEAMWEAPAGDRAVLERIERGPARA